VFIAVYTYDLKNLIEKLKKARYMDELERQELESQRQTYRTIKQNQSKADAPSDLAIDLQRKLLDYEQTLLANAHQTFVENQLLGEIVDVDQLQDQEPEEEMEEEDSYDDLEGTGVDAQQENQNTGSPSRSERVLEDQPQEADDDEEEEEEDEIILDQSGTIERTADQEEQSRVIQTFVEAESRGEVTLPNLPEPAMPARKDLTTCKSPHFKHDCAD